MTVSFPLVLEAVQQGERSTWRIGDALLKEIDSAQTHELDGAVQFKKCSKMLVEQGFTKYSAGMLRRLYKTSKAFPPASRHRDLGWTIHDETATPENLEQVLKRLRSLRRTPTQDNVRMVMRQWHKKESDARKEKHAKAEADREAAKEARRKAQEAELKAKTKEERERAKAAKEQAKQQEQAAKRQAQETRGPPQSKAYQSEPPEKSDLLVMAEVNRMQAVAETFRMNLRDDMKKLDKIIDQISPEAWDAVFDTYTELAITVQQFLDRFKKKERFQVVQGGAA